MNATTETAVLGSFSTVDQTPDAAALVAALDDQASIPAIKRLRAAATDLLAARLGHRIIDVGCGTGEVARAIARRVGRTGRVIGIDNSETMLAEARQRVAGTTPQVEFQAGDVTRLDLENATFDGALCERVFQHLATPQAAMAELARITRPGGRIVVVDTDWGLHAIYGADPSLTTTIVDSWAGDATNGLAGRQLAARFADVGMPHPTVVAETLTSTDPLQPLSPPITTMATAAVHAGAVRAIDADRWISQLADAGKQGRFFWTVTMFAVAGTRPPGSPCPTDHRRENR